MKKGIAWMRGGVALAALFTGLAAAQAGSLKIESWRNDDADIWNCKIIPAFNKHYPDIKVEFSPSAPTEYNAALNARLDGGTAGDLITCRPFDASLEHIPEAAARRAQRPQGHGQLLRRRQGRVVDRRRQGRHSACRWPRSSTASSTTRTPSRRSAPPPKTMAEFHAILDKLKKDGTYTPIDLGTADQWEAATMGFQNIGPDYWKGETGRAGPDRRQGEIHRPAIRRGVQGARLAGRPTWATAIQAQKYPDSQNLFSLGKAAIYPAGSWDISTFRARREFPIGVFPPPLPAGDTECYISDHTDIAHGRQRGVEEQGGREEVPRMADDAGIRDALRQRAAGLLPAQQGRR